MEFVCRFTDHRLNLLERLRLGSTLNSHAFAFELSERSSQDMLGG